MPAQTPHPAPSADHQPALRQITLWAAQYVARALPIFESQVPGDSRPRDAITASQTFAYGAARDKALRTAAWDAHKAAAQAEPASAKHAARAAMLTAAIAYTHTDLTTGTQGISQAQHLLGPIVYAALAIGAADDLFAEAAQTAPPELINLLQQFPPQPGGRTTLKRLYQELDTALRNRPTP